MKKLSLILTVSVAALLASSCMNFQRTLCVNPLTYTDIPDNDVIRVGEDYYMVSTTMYFCPGAPIMHSRDLVHWRIVSYVYDCLADDDIYNLRDGKNAYGCGQWATSLRYHDGEFYALFIAKDQGCTYIYHTKDITTSYWDRYVIDRPLHDPGLLFDDGRVFVAWGNGDIRLTELAPDFSGVIGEDKLLFSTPQGYMLKDEGSHFYHIDDWYYVLTINWLPGDVRTETCWRSHNIEGPYESKTILKGAFDGRRDGVAQGAIVDTPDGKWYAMMFQDHGAVGRIPTLQPVKWVSGWPVLGDATVPVKEFKVNLPTCGVDWVWDNDEFESETLPLVWQWNHKPLDGKWSLTDRPGYLSIDAVKADNIFNARNVLTQRTVGPACESSALLDASQLADGDHAGICAFQSNFCAVEVERKDGGNYISVIDKTGEICREPMASDSVMLKLIYDFSEDKAEVAYSFDGQEWTRPEYQLEMRFTLDFFTGYRTALYCYNTEGDGGRADFGWFHQNVVE